MDMIFCDHHAFVSGVAGGLLLGIILGIIVEKACKRWGAR